MRKLIIEVRQTETNMEVAQAFDYEFDGIVTTEIHELNINDLPKDFGIGLIVGASGSGKSTNLDLFGNEMHLIWDNNASICDHFPNSDEAKKKLSAVGLNSIPTWIKPFNVCSTGEKFRASLARKLCDNAVIDEFTSVVDRDVAKAAATSVSKHVKREGLKGLVFASCHFDIIEWLQPDWVFNTDDGTLTLRGSLRPRPKLNIKITPCGWQEWDLFSKHHYLDSKINKAAWCWIITLNDKKIGFASALAFPNGNFRNGWRGHRTVILPEFQGLGIGVRASDAVANIMLGLGKRYFSKTANPAMGLYRESSPLWKPTSKNKKKRLDYKTNRATKEAKYKHRHIDRLCYSHEYIG